MESIQITQVIVKKNKADIYFKVSKGIEKYFEKNHHFFLEYNFDISIVPKSVIVIPIMLNLLQFSWLTNSVIWVDEIDKDFYNCIPQLKYNFKEIHPNIELKGTLIAARLIDNKNTRQKNNILQLFTGGVDATSTLIRIIDQKPILFNTNGWYIDNPAEINRVYDADKSSINKIAENFGLSSKFLKSNFATFIISKKVDDDFCKKNNTTWWFGFQHSMAFLGAAIVVAYKFDVNKIYIASSYTFGQYIKCVSDPRIDNCIKCAGIETIHDGYELSRQDKIRLIVQYQRKENKKIALRVCSFNTHNCCECEKCFRTMLALIAEGVNNLEDYGFYFENTILDNLKYFIFNHANELDYDHIVFWNDIIKKMKENYDNLSHKEVYDFLSKIDLKKARKKAIWNHYRKDYKEIIHRKIFG